MKSPNATDYFILTFLALLWASAFFNIKIATYSYGPITIAFLRIFLYLLLNYVGIIALTVLLNMSLVMGTCYIHLKKF